MKKLLLLFALVGCTDATEARRILEAQGFSDIQITGYAPFDCSKDDTVQTGFRAKGPTGKPVAGTVCCGLVLRNCTVRFE